MTRQHSANHFGSLTNLAPRHDGKLAGCKH
jgi:hypothetical protein